VWLVIPFVLVLGSVWVARRVIRRYDGVLPRETVPSARRVAKAILKRHGIRDVAVEPGEDNFYLPVRRRIELSHESFKRRSTAAAAIAAHEAAHAIQHATRLRAFMVSNALAVPSALVSLAWFPLAVAAIVLGSDVVAGVASGLFVFAAGVSALRAWVEVDASRRALRELRALPDLDIRGARRVLTACGATYVADAVVDLGFVGRRMRKDDDHGTQPSGDGADDVLAVD
jgi:Zn-dependent membrane protease YugP